MHGRIISGPPQTAKERQNKKEEKMSSKKDMIQPDQAKTKKTHVRRQSIYSGKPNCEYV